MDDNLIRKAIERCGSIAGLALGGDLNFGPRTIIDPDTGAPINVEGYNIEANQSLLCYMYIVGDTLERYYECIKDIFFFEMILSPEYFPEFHMPEYVSRYLKINYQNWIIRINTIYDCTSHALNAVFELKYLPKKIVRSTIKSDSVIRNHEAIFKHIENLDHLLRSAIAYRKSHPTLRTIEGIRHKIIHYYEFEHSGLSTLDFDTMLFNFEMLEMDAFQFQASVGSTSFELISEVRETNIKIINEVYPIFEYIGVEYNRRFQEKLVE